MNPNQNGEMNSDLENRFTYHAPMARKEGQPAKYEALRAKGKELAYLIMNNCPLWAGNSLGSNEVGRSDLLGQRLYR